MTAPEVIFLSRLCVREQVSLALTDDCSRGHLQSSCRDYVSENKSDLPPLMTAPEVIFLSRLCVREQVRLTPTDDCSRGHLQSSCRDYVSENKSDLPSLMTAAEVIFSLLVATMCQRTSQTCPH
ncbi:hypothetical protein BsWGS_21631 [Bradybaena similaris]